MIDATLPWYALTVLTGHELPVANEMRDLGRAAYVPHAWVDIRNPRTRRVTGKRAVPILPGYVFAGNPHWAHIRAHKHITGVIAFDHIPVRLSPRDLERLATLRLPDPDPITERLRPGDLVTLIDGPLAGTICRLRDLRDTKAKIQWGKLGDVVVDVANLAAA